MESWFNCPKIYPAFILKIIQIFQQLSVYMAVVRTFPDCSSPVFLTVWKLFAVETISSILSWPTQPSLPVSAGPKRSELGRDFSASLKQMSCNRTKNNIFFLLVVHNWIWVVYLSLPITTVDSDPNVFYNNISVFFDNSRARTPDVDNVLALEPVQHYLDCAYFAHQCLSVLCILENKAHNNKGLSHSHGGDL